MAVGIPQRRPAVTQYDEELLKALRQASQVHPSQYARESQAGSFPWGSLTQSLLGGLLAGRQRQEIKAKQAQSDAANIALTEGLLTNQIGDIKIGPSGSFYTVPKDLNAISGVLQETAPEMVPRLDGTMEAASLEELGKLAIQGKYREGISAENIPSHVPAYDDNENLVMVKEKHGGRIAPQIAGDAAKVEPGLLDFNKLQEKYAQSLPPKEAFITIPGRGKPDSVIGKIAELISGPSDVTDIKAKDIFELAQASGIDPLPLYAYLQDQKTKSGETTFTKPELSYISQTNEDNTINNINALTRVATITNANGTTEQRIEIRENGIFRPLKPNEKFIPKISEKDNTPRYFRNNGGDITYIDTDGVEKTLKNGEQFRVETGSPTELLKLSKTQDAQEIKLIGDKGFAPRPLIIPDNPGEVAARIISSHGTNGYNESIMVSKDLEIDTPNGTIMFKADQKIETNDPNYNLLKNTLQESSYSNISSFASSGLLSSAKLNDLRAEVLTARTGFFNLANYVNTIDRTNLGLQRDIDKVTSWFKTVFMPEKQLDDQQVALRIANGQLSRLGGTLRLDILGPGVMTEQDFLRLREALGNDPNSAQSIQAFKETLHLILKEKEMTYKDKNSYYEKQRTAVPQREKGFPSIDLEIPEYKSFFEVTTEPTFITGTIMNMQPNDNIFKSINKTMNAIQQRTGKVTEEEMLKFYNKRQLNAIKKRFDQLGIQ